jgi:putative salt-induced outer membrane protein YdiY
LTLLFAVNVRADSILLRGGEKLIGKVISEETLTVVFESKTLGRFEIAREDIERIERDLATVSTNPAAIPAASKSTPTNSFYPWLTPQASAENDQFDWIQLKSGEWLKGKIKSLQEEKLEFDSEEMDRVTFDWKDIRTVRSPRLNSVRIENLKPVDGRVFVTTNEVSVITATGTNTYARADLIAITPTGNREIDKWTGSISAGVSFRSGNTRETDVNSHVGLQRRTPDTRLTLDYLGNYGKVNGTQVEQNHRFAGYYDYFLTRRFYTRLPDVEYFRDPVGNVDHRLTLGGGVGYDLVKTSRAEWNVTLGPAWQRTWFHDVPPGEDSSAQSLAVVLQTRADIELSQRLDLIFLYRGQLTRKETGNNLHHGEATLEFEIHKRLKLDLSLQWDRTTTPKAESGGDIPKTDDFRLITSIGVDF